MRRRGAKIRVLIQATSLVAITCLSGALAFSSAEPLAAVQTAATGNVMRQKLAHSKSILEAIMTSNYEELDSHATALARVTESAGWWVLQSPEYRLQSSAFLRSVQDLIEAAKRRDLDGALKSYNTMTMRCYECHKYMKGARIAKPAQ